MVGKNYVSSEQYKITGGAVDSYVPQTKFGRHIVFAPFLIIIKSRNKVWGLIVFAPFLLIIIIIIIPLLLLLLLLLAVNLSDQILRD